MGVKYLWDTNIAVYYLQRQFSPEAENFMDELLKESLPCISAVTEIELLCWKATTPKDRDVLASFIDDAVVIELEHLIKRKSAEIRSIYKIKLPDAIIAATAIVYDCTLLTRNVADFFKIETLKIINPWDGA